MIGTPSSLCKWGCSSLPKASVEPPGGKGTTIRIGPLGQVPCARAMCGAANKAGTPARMARLLIM
jgi:hypothetical protein